MTLLQHTRKVVHMNTLEQYYNQLDNHQNKTIPEQHTGDCNRLFEIVCDLQMNHTTTWCNTQLLQTHPSSLLQHHISYQNINLTSLWHSTYSTIIFDIGKNRRTQQNYLLLVTQYYYLLYNATSFDPTMGSSGQEQKIGDMKCTWKCLTGSRLVYIGLYIYLYISTSNEKWTCL
jgi:hypothetical protein